MLAIPTFAVFDVLTHYVDHKMNVGLYPILFAILFDIGMYLMVSLLMAFLPQAAGAIGGFVIWRLTTGEGT